MPDSPKAKTDPPKAKNDDDIIEESDDEEEVELVKPEDLKNNNNQPRGLIPRPASELLRPPLFQPFPYGVGPRLGSFPGWLYPRHPQMVQPPLPHPGYPIGRGHELMRRLCTMNPAFAQSIIEDYIRPQV